MKIDHIGLVVKSVSEAASQLSARFGYVVATDMIDVPSQKIRCQYVENAQGVRLQLIEPSRPDSPVSGALKKGGGLHHICYACSDLTRELERCRRAGGLVVTKPFSGEGVGGRLAAFVMDPVLGLIELVAED